MVREIRKREEVEIQTNIWNSDGRRFGKGRKYFIHSDPKKKRCGNIWNGDGRRLGRRDAETAHVTWGFSDFAFFLPGDDGCGNDERENRLENRNN